MKILVELFYTKKINFDRKLSKIKFKRIIKRNKKNKMFSLNTSNLNISKEITNTYGHPPTDKKLDHKKAKKPTINSETAIKNEVLEIIGIIDPLIKESVDTRINKINYKRKTKFEVTDEVCDDLDSHIEKLKLQRLRMLMVRHNIIHFPNLKYRRMIHL